MLRMPRAMIIVILLVVIISQALGDDESPPSAKSVYREVDEIKLPEVETTPSTSTVTETTPTTTTAVTPPPQEEDGHVAGEIITQDVTGWGETVTSQRVELTLRTIGHQPGDAAGTTQINLEVCATADVSLPTGQDDYNSVILLKMPDDGLMDDEVRVVSHAIVMDSDAVRVVDMEGQLMPVLPAGACTFGKIQLFSEDVATTVIGFGHFAMPNGELRSDGGFTRLQPDGEATSFNFVFEMS